MTESVSSTENNKEYKIDAFFAGVGGIELGFEQTGEFRTVYANEFDKNARETYQLNSPKTPLDGRDIHDIDPSEIPSCDIVVGGFPCQAFSIAGYRKGFEDERGDLFFELLRMIRAKKPQVIFIENVKNMVTHDHGNTFKVIREALLDNGYHIKWKVLNGKDYGNIPQNRERIYIVGFRNRFLAEKFSFPEKIELKTRIQDIIDFNSEVDEKFYYREGKQKFFDVLKKSMSSHDTVYQWRRQYVRENKSGVIPTLTANMGTGGHNVPLILNYSGDIRKLTPKETFYAQGYPKWFQLPDISNGQLYKQAGNSVVVPVIRRIAQCIADVLATGTTSGAEEIENLNYHLVRINQQGIFEGESMIIASSDNKNELVAMIHEKNLEVLSDQEYLHLVNKKKSKQFYMIIES